MIEPGMVEWDGFVNQDTFNLFDKYEVPHGRGRPYAAGGICLYVYPPIAALLTLWAYKFRPPRNARAEGIVNANGLPMSFEDYVREVVAPACKEEQ